MKNDLEQFIVENKKAFDDKEVSEKLWNRIEADLDPPQIKKDYGWVWKVAALLFIGATLVLLFDKYQFSQNNQLTQYAGYNQELIDVEMYYTQQISVKRSELENNLSDKEKEAFLGDLNDLDRMYLQLKSDLEDNQNNNKLISAMIQNLQLRVEILNKQLSILERINKVEKDENISI